MGRKKRMKSDEGERKLVRILGLRALGVGEALGLAEIALAEKLGEMEVALATSVGAEGYVALRLGLATEGRKALRASLKGLNKLTATALPVAERVAMRALDVAAEEAAVRETEAEAQLRLAEAQLTLARLREGELEVKQKNAETERIKALRSAS